MVIPWVGFPLADFVKRFEPSGNAKYVEFKTLLDLKQMPGQSDPVLQWPYTEGLRMDRAWVPGCSCRTRPSLTIQASRDLFRRDTGAEVAKDPLDHTCFDRLDLALTCRQ